MPEAASPRHFVFSPDARFVYLLNELDASIDVLAYDAFAGTLGPVQNIGTLPPGFSGKSSWAADLHLTPDGRFLYSSSERGAPTRSPPSGVDAANGELPAGRPLRRPKRRSRAASTSRPTGRFLIAAGQRSERLRLYARSTDGGRAR